MAAGGFAEGGDRRSLHLHDRDVDLIRAVSTANPRTVVALVAGSAVVISEWDASVPAIVQCWYSGMEGGHGLADVLLGAVDCSGRLPFSVPRAASNLPAFDADADEFVYDAWHGYWHLDRQGTPPAYPFGFGLSYTTFELESAEAEADGGGIRVRASMRNSGPRAGTDVLQVYVRRLTTDGPDRPERLAGFTRFELEPGAVAAVECIVAPDALAERDVDIHAMVVRPGTYLLRVARNASDDGIRVQVAMGGADL